MTTEQARHACKNKANKRLLLFLTTLLNKLQQFKIIQNIGDKQNYISRVVYPKGKRANGTLGPMRGAPHEIKVTRC